jgi:hypothetical protein
MGGNISGESTVSLVAETGQIVIHGKIDGDFDFTGSTTVVRYRCDKIDVLRGVLGDALFLCDKTRLDNTKNSEAAVEIGNLGDVDPEESSERVESSANKVIESHTERQEVAENVFLVSTFIADTNQYELTVENSRNERLMCSIDFSGSSNLRMASGGSMKTFLSADARQESEVIYLQKEDPDADSEFAVSFTTIEKTTGTAATTDAPLLSTMEGISLEEPRVNSVPALPSPACTETHSEQGSSSVAAGAAAFNQNAGFVPAPAKFKKVEATTEVKFFGGQRMAFLKKA